MMKSWLICLVFISMLAVGQEVVAETKHLTFLDPCNQPTPPPSCSKILEGKVIANPYDRGCSAINQCRGGWCQSIFKTLFASNSVKVKTKLLFNKNSINILIPQLFTWKESKNVRIKAWEIKPQCLS